MIGAGWWSTQAHLPALRDYERAEVVALADPSPEKLQAAARAYGIERAYADHRELLARERPDGAVIATPPAFHHQLARDTLEAGASVLVEKPMTLRLAEAVELVRLADALGLELMVGYTWHFNPHARALRAELAAGRIGEIQLVTSLFASKVIEFYRGRPERYREVFDYPVTGPDRRTYSDPRIAGGGQGQTQITHSAALLFWLTGLAPELVFAQMERHGLAVDVVDAIIVRLAGGALATLAGTGNVQTQREQLEYRLHGTEGAVLVDFVAGSAEIHDADGSVEQLSPVSPDDVYPLYAPARHFADVILGQAESEAPGALGALTVGFLEAAYRSAEEGVPEPVEPVPRKRQVRD